MNIKIVRNSLIVFFVIIIIFSLSFFVAIKKNVLAGKATITWQENKESNIAGYKIYYGTEARKGNTPQDCGYSDTIDTKLEHTYKFDKLSLFKTYYFSTTAYNKAGKESGFSEEVSKKIGIRDIFKK